MGWTLTYARPRLAPCFELAPLGKLASLGALLALAACTAQRLPNAPLAAQDPRGGHRFDPAPVVDENGSGNGNDVFVVLAFSGGGTRAAALSYGVLAELRDNRIHRPRDGTEVRLLDEVDLITSVSGGSFTSAYYGLFGDRIFEDFEDRFLYRDLKGELLSALFGPVNWPRLFSTHYDRTDLAAEIYDETIFDGKAFAELRRRSVRPFVVVNATNISTGTQFSFVQDSFDVLGSDLDPYPVANAVAASSAVPILFSPMTLQNHPAPPGFRPPTWVCLDAHEDRRLERTARALGVYHEDKDAHPYLHVVDGGVADNTGLNCFVGHYRWGIIDDLLEPDPRIDGHPVEGIRNLLVIVVNAMNRLSDDLDRDSASPDIIDAALRSISATIDNNTVETVQGLEDLFAARRAEEAEALPEGEAPRVRLYLVEVAFADVIEPAERERFLAMPTSLVLEPREVADVVRAGRRLLRRHPEFRRFLRDHGELLPAPRGPPPAED